MSIITCLPDNRTLPVVEGETILAATLGARIPHAHACGGQGKCSTCRVWILDGLAHCCERSEQEQALAARLGFGPEVRLACQTTVEGDVKLRRLVLDATDLEITNQLSRRQLGLVGKNKDVAVLFSDIRGFTRLTETLSAYDVVFVLSRYFHHVGDAIERNGGFIVDFYGDGVMALFGIDDEPLAPLRGVRAALDILDAVDRFRPYMQSMYGEAFEVGVGLHYGPAVIGTVGSATHEKMTAVGDTVNIANRVEAATKESGLRMLVSDRLYEEVTEDVTVGDFVRVTLRGTSERRSLYEVTGLTPSGAEKLRKDEPADPTRERFHGRDWIRVLAEDELGVGDQKVVELPHLDLLLIRTEHGIHVVNNACPHLHLPLVESVVTPEESIVCRWHESRFDLDTGEILAWCPALNEHGLSEGMEYLGNISKNPTPLVPLPVRAQDGYLWVSLE